MPCFIVSLVPELDALNQGEKGGKEKVYSVIGRGFYLPLRHFYSCSILVLNLHKLSTRQQQRMKMQEKRVNFRISKQVDYFTPSPNRCGIAKVLYFLRMVLLKSY